jgi:hypothetical protein
MTKPKFRPKATTRSTARKNAKPTSRKRSAPASPKSAMRPGTKHAHIVAMLRAPGRRNNRCDDGHNRMAAAFSARLSCRCHPQETRAQPCFRADR